MKLYYSNAYLRLKRIVMRIVVIAIVISGSFISAQAQAPTITSFTPATICQGDPIKITGTGFSGMPDVSFGNTHATNIKVVNSTTITANVASDAPSGVIKVTVNNLTGTSSGQLTVNPAPIPLLNDVTNPDNPFTNCDGNESYQLTVSNGSTPAGGSCAYDIDWGDGTTHFTQEDWPVSSQISHTFNAQGYFNIVLTIMPANGCKKTFNRRFYNGTNPLASLTTTSSTTGLCIPASVEFQIGNWAGNSTGTSYQLDFGDGSPFDILQHPLNATGAIQFLSHLYTTSSCPNIDFTATLYAVNGCFTTKYTLNQIIIRKKPVADFSTQPIPACVNGPVCFVNTTTDGYSGNSCNTTSNYTWNFGDGSTTNLETPACHNYTSPGTYNVMLSASNLACGSDSITKQVVVHPTSPPPMVAATPVSYCQGQAAVPLTATGTGLLWYTSQNGIASSIAPIPSTAITGTFNFYVTQTLTNDCESPKVAITVTVNAAPAAPVVTTPVQLCQNQVAVPLTATGSSLLWYIAPNGGTGSATHPTPVTTTLGMTFYYVSQTTNSCESPRAVILVTINSLATAPVVTSPLIYCHNQTAVPLTATGTGLLWYTVATGGTGSSAAPTPSTTTVGNTTYYVSQVTGCGEGPRDSITVTIKASPTATIKYNTTNLCNVVNSANTPNPPIAVTLTGTGGGSYTISPATGLTIDAVTGTINPSGATAGSYTITYTIAGSGGCSDFTTTAAINVNGTPAATITYPSICTSDAATAVQLTGSQGGTFTSASGLIINTLTGTITPASSVPGNYTVTYTIAASAPCPGFVTTANVSITKAPAASITYTTPSLCNVVNSANTPNPPIAVTLTGTGGGSYTISPATGLTIDAVTGTINPSGATAGSYTITYTIAGSGGCSDFTTTAAINVNGTPAATITYPSICTSDAATAVQLTGSQGGTFTSASGLIINTLTGTITPASSVPGNYTVTYTIAASAPCPGFVTTANVSITKAPAASITYTTPNLCNVINSAGTPNPPISVTLTGTAGGSYSISPANGLPINAATGTLNPSGSSPGQYTITYTITGGGGCADFTTTATVKVSVAPTATINYPGSPFCQAISTPQKVFATGTQGGSYSSGTGLSINATTGDINPSLSTPGIYTVTYTITPSLPCPGYIATTSVEIDQSPVLTFPISTQSVCSGGTAVFTPSSTVPNTTYTWSIAGTLPADVTGITSGTASGSNAVISLSFINSSTTTQSIVVQVTPSNPSQNPCAGAPYNITLNVNPVPAAPVSDTVDFCMGTPPAPLTATILPGNTINWYDGNFVLLNSAPVISTAIPAQFIYYASQTNSFGCESPKAKILGIVHPTVKIISSSYTNPTTCGIPSGSIVLNVLDLNNNSIPDFPLFVHYTKFQTAYQIADSTDAHGQITVPLAAGTYSGIYVETGGCLSQKIPNVFVLKDPDPPSQPVAGYNPPLCSETPLNLTAISATGTAIGPLDYVWVGPAFGPLADTIKQTFISFPSASVSDAGTYIVYAIQNNCVSSATSFQVVIKQAPSKPQINTRTPLCIGDALTLQAFSSIPGANAVLNYSWTGPGRGFPVNAPNAGINSVVVQDAGIYTITVSSPQTGCSTTSDTLIQIGGYPIVKFAQDSLTLPTGYLLNLNPLITNASDPNILPIKSFEWTPSQDIACNDSACSSPVATIKDNICYTVKATNIYGCSGSAVICIKVFCQNSQVFIPNAFTPNGNLENRILMVRASGVASVKSFRIFNRWGRIVFEQNNFVPNNPDYGWDGKFNGKLADAGVYVYTAEVICDNGVSYFKKGNITLLY